MLALVPLRAGESIHVRANQLGYLPKAPKLGVAFSRHPLPERFAVLDVGSGKRVLEPSIRPLTPASWGRFDHFGELDFTRLARPGRYVLVVGDTASRPFEIGTGALRLLPDSLLEFMRQQRCGYNPWLGAHCHPHDGRTAYGPRPAGSELDARGGWHDAGDLLKYLLTSGNATAHLLLAWEIAGDRQERSRGSLPVSGLAAAPT